MRFTAVFAIMLTSFLACKQEQSPKPEVSDEIEFRIDSSYFDFAVKDTFHNIILPALKNWNQKKIENSGLEKDSYLLIQDSLNVAIIVSSHDRRRPNSYGYYQNLIQEDKLNMEVLDLSNFLKDRTKLTQVIMKNENQVIFKIIYDNDQSSDELDIFVDKADYNEKNILLVESVIGQIDFLNS